ncbi:glycosyltransferase [Clostridium perfringens]
MYKVGICGHFAIGKNFADGQTIKTRIIGNEIKSKLGSNNVKFVDTHMWRNNKLKLLTQFISLCKESDKLIVLPDQNGVKAILPLSVMLKIFKKYDIHYIVIGGWLPYMLSRNNILKYFIKKITAVHVETTTMKRQMQDLGFTNISIMANIKKLSVLSENDLVNEFKKPYKLCTFSRVVKEKGIEDICNAIQRINSKFDETLFTLDIYGQIDNNYEDYFFEYIKSLPDYIKYKGIVEQSESVSIVKQYLMLVFPTLFKTEGIPGTIIDAYASGVPVLASEWESCHDIIDNNVTGIIYKFKDREELYNKLIYIANNIDEIIKMRKNCLNKSKLYLSDNVINEFIKIL